MAVVTPDRAERTRRGLARWCSQAETAHDLFEGVSRRLRPVIGYDIAAWLVTDPATVLFTDAYIEGFPSDTCGTWFHHELNVPDTGLFRDLAANRRPVSILGRAVDGDLSKSARWGAVLEPIGYGRELRVAFRDGTACWGVATLNRSSSSRDFEVDEADLLASVSSEVASGLRRIVRTERALAAGPDGPGLLLVGPDHVARPATEAGERWLELLGVPASGPRHTVLLTLGELVTGGGVANRRVRLRTRNGEWATLYAEPMNGEEGSFAVIVEPSRPADIAVVVALAYGLSARESELVLALARGEGTDQIASNLHISPHTVRDHLKAIFDKTDVGSRNELIARLFHDHYAEHVFSEAAVHG